MSNGYTNESLEAILESLESDESDEAVWRRPFNRGSAPRTTPSTSYQPPVNNTIPVTQRDLQDLSNKLDTKINGVDARHTTETNKLDARVTTAENKMQRQTVVLRKESDERKKDISNLKNNVQLATLLPLLIKPATRSVSKDITDTELKKDDKILVDTGDSLTALLPLLLLGGLGGSSDTSASGGGSFNDPTTLLLVVLAASGGLGGKK